MKVGRHFANAVSDLGPLGSLGDCVRVLRAPARLQPAAAATQPGRRPRPTPAVQSESRGPGANAENVGLSGRGGSATEHSLTRTVHEHAGSNDTVPSMSSTANVLEKRTGEKYYATK